MPAKKVKRKFRAHTKSRAQADKRRAKAKEAAAKKLEKDKPKKVSPLAPSPQRAVARAGAAAFKRSTAKQVKRLRKK